MIRANIEINQNKLEEFMRVLLPEHYDILSENSEKDVEISVNFDKSQDVENFDNDCGKLKDSESDNTEIITVNTVLIDNKNGKILKEVTFSHKKVNEEYFDQAEVMAKSSLMELFNKKNEYKWGILIGVRPTKIIGRFLKMGLSYEEIDEIADWTCANDGELKEVYIYSKLKRIGEGAFFNCRNLEKIIIFDDWRDQKKTNERICNNIDELKKEFDGEIGIHAFENYFDDNILIKNNNEDANRDKFEKALAPAPFYENNEERIFLKILEGDEEGFFNISLLNYNMLKYDINYFNRDIDKRKKYYYRPYFYEFATEKVDDKSSKFAQEHLGEWMLGELKNMDYINDNEHIFEGEVLSSANPIDGENRKLLVYNEKLPEPFLHNLNETYAIKKGSKTNSNNVNDVINKIIINNASLKSLKTYNVGQASSNIISFDNNKNIIFDIGIGCRSKNKKDFQNEAIEENLKKLQQYKADVVIISHWHLDHYKIAESSPNDLLYDADWIVPELNAKKNGSNEYRLAKYLSNYKKINFIERGLKGQKIFDSGLFSIWTGLGEKGINNSGLIVTLNKNGNNILLPGDCEYQNIPAKVFDNGKRYKFMIVPHHGAKMEQIQSDNKLDNNIELDSTYYAFISTGHNNYGHPNAQHIEYLKKQGYKVEITKGRSIKDYEINLNDGTISITT